MFMRALTCNAGMRARIFANAFCRAQTGCRGPRYMVSRSSCSRGYAHAIAFSETVKCGYICDCVCSDSLVRDWRGVQGSSVRLDAL